MSLHKKPESVLTHGGHSELAMASTLGSRAAHHENEHPSLFAGTGGQADIPERHLGYALNSGAGLPPEPTEDYYPRHVHAENGDHRVVANEQEHASALDEGWMDTPAEKEKEEE